MSPESSPRALIRDADDQGEDEVQVTVIGCKEGLEHTLRKAYVQRFDPGRLQWQEELEQAGRSLRSSWLHVRSELDQLQAIRQQFRLEQQDIFFLTLDAQPDVEHGLSTVRADTYCLHKTAERWDPQPLACSDVQGTYQVPSAACWPRETWPDSAEI